MNKFTIITDGGKLKEKSASAYIVYLNNECILSDTFLLYNKSVNYVELYSIVIAMEDTINFIRKNNIKDFKINIFSDSLNSINPLRSIILKRFKLIGERYFYYKREYLKDKTKIIFKENEFKCDHELYKRFEISIRNIEKCIKIYHLKAHQNLDRNLYKNFIKHYKKSKISYSYFRLAYKALIKCDETVKAWY